MTRGVRKTTGVTVLIVFMLSRPLPAQTPQIDALRESAQQGNAEAQYEFGCMHDVGCLDEINLIDSQDVEVDTIGDTEAARWYRLAAEQGHARAQSRLGDFTSSDSAFHGIMPKPYGGIDSQPSREVPWRSSPSGTDTRPVGACR